MCHHISTGLYLLCFYRIVDSSWNVMANGDAREGKLRGNWRLEWVASTLHTTSEHGLFSITTADAHTSAASSRLNWRPSADLNGLVLFAERLNVVSARLPSHFNWPLPREFYCFKHCIRAFLRLYLFCFLSLSQQPKSCLGCLADEVHNGTCDRNVWSSPLITLI